MRPVFFETDLQKEFDRLGYAHLPGFLNMEEVEELKQAYFDTLPERGGSILGSESDFKTESVITYDFTFIDRNWEYKQKVFDLITAVFEDKYATKLYNYSPIIANFIRKEENDGEVPLHQNWAFVDERRFTSVSIWVPLMDSNVANGTLEMVDGSHKRFGELRGPLIPWELDKVGRDIIADFMTPMNVNAGDAVVLDDSLVHYSNINQTDGLRLTIQLILVPKEVEVLHYHLDQKVDEHKVNVLGVDRDFFMKFHPWAKPHGRDLGSRKFRKRYLSRAEFEKRLLAPRFDEKPKGFLGKIKSIFR